MPYMPTVEALEAAYRTAPLPCYMALCLTACGQSATGPGTELFAAISGVHVSVGDTVQLGIFLERGGRTYQYPPVSSGVWSEDVSITWSAAPPGVVTLSEAGVATGQALGTTSVSISAAGAHDIALVRVGAVASSPEVRFNSLDVSPFHGCAMITDGRAACWGSHWFGQLGVGEMRRLTQFVAPHIVTGGVSFEKLALGDKHTCGLAASTVYCWGQNDKGQLGDDSNVPRSVPEAVASDEIFIDLAAGGEHTCALNDTGLAFCWGWNSEGELGVGSSAGLGDFRSRPTEVVGGLVLSRITAGSFHTCGLAEDGAAYCWGANTRGQLGAGTTASKSTPLPVDGGHSFETINAGAEHTCGISMDAQVLCWGKNDVGQLGSESGGVTPALVPGITVASLALGASHTCAATPEGSAYCWGSNWAGQLGTGTGGYGTGEVLGMPTPVADDLVFASLSAGGDVTCGLTTDGQAYCWGADTGSGVLGHGRRTGSLLPVAVVDPFE